MMSLEEEIERRLRIIEETEEEVEFPFRDDVTQMEITRDKDELDGIKLVSRYRRHFKPDTRGTSLRGSGKFLPDRDVVELVSIGNGESILYSKESTKSFLESNPKVITRINRAIISPDCRRAAFEVFCYRKETCIDLPRIIAGKEYGDFYLTHKKIYVVNTNEQFLNSVSIALPRLIQGEVSVAYPHDDYDMALTSPFWVSPDSIEFVAREHKYKKSKCDGACAGDLKKIDINRIVGLDFKEALSLYQCRIRLGPDNKPLESLSEAVHK